MRFFGPVLELVEGLLSNRVAVCHGGRLGWLFQHRRPNLQDPVSSHTSQTYETRRRAFSSGNFLAQDSAVHQNANVCKWVCLCCMKAHEQVPYQSTNYTATTIAASSGLNLNNAECGLKAVCQLGLHSGLVFGRELVSSVGPHRVGKCFGRTHSQRQPSIHNCCFSPSQASVPCTGAAASQCVTPVS